MKLIKASGAAFSSGGLTPPPHLPQPPHPTPTLPFALLPYFVYVRGFLGLNERVWTRL